MYVVTPNRRLDGTSERTTQLRRCRQVAARTPGSRVAVVEASKDGRALRHVSTAQASARSMNARYPIVQSRL